jgi:hypothetical protein
MLEEFLTDIGLHQTGERLDLPQLLGGFSAWLDAQEVGEDDQFYLASRIGAFICEFLIDAHEGQRLVNGGRIVMRMPIADGVAREFNPYAVAIGMVRNRNSLKEYLDVLCS